MTFEEYKKQDAVGLAELVKQKQVAPTELLDIAIKRTEEVNPKINAIITELYDFGKRSISELNSSSPFAGVPFLLKDLCIQLKGTRYTSASRLQKDYISTQTSSVVQKAIDGGFIIFGKTNTSEFGLNPFVENDLFGNTKNPWNLECTPGGSSGGSAAAVAAGIVPMATANDGGGSIRIPASCNGLFGLKPSRGRVSLGPISGDLWSGAATHELCVSRSVRDSAHYLDLVCGNTIGDPYIIQKPDRPYAEEIKIACRKLKIGFSYEHPFGEQDEENISAIKHTVKILQQEGHEVTEVKLPYSSQLVSDCLYSLVIGELSATIELIAKERGKSAQVEEIEPTNWLLYTLGKKISANEFCLSKLQWNILSRSMEKFHEEYDLLLTPTLGMRPFKIGALQPKSWEQVGLKFLNSIGATGLLRHTSLIEETKKKIFQWIPYPPLANLTGQPSMSVPLYWSKENLPIGVMFTGRLNDEATLLRLAAQLEKAEPWFDKVPQL
ncbi:MAG: Amidase [Bacteroidota bacterium]|nr:Amidase [Bacteroidota bacterium]